MIIDGQFKYDPSRLTPLRNIFSQLLQGLLGDGAGDVIIGNPGHYDNDDRDADRQVQ